MHASAIETTLCSLFMAKLAWWTLLEMVTVVLPCRFRKHAVEADQFREFCDWLSGLTVNIILEV